MALDLITRQEFLAEPHVAALAVAHAGRAPLTVPLWYQYAPGGELAIVTSSASRKAELIRAAGRFSMLVDRVVPTVRYVSVEGPVSGMRVGTTEDIRAMAVRYLSPDQVEAYVAVALADHGEQVVISMAPEHWLSADLG